MNQQNMKLNISLDKTSGVSCDLCENTTFQEALILRKASKFLTGTEQDGIIPIPTFVCSKCGHVNDDFYPKELNRDKK